MKFRSSWARDSLHSGQSAEDVVTKEDLAEADWQKRRGGPDKTPLLRQKGNCVRKSRSSCRTSGSFSTAATQMCLQKEYGGCCVERCSVSCGLESPPFSTQSLRPARSEPLGSEALLVSKFGLN